MDFKVFNPHRNFPICLSRRDIETNLPCPLTYLHPDFLILLSRREIETVRFESRLAKCCSFPILLSLREIETFLDVGLFKQSTF